MTQRKTFNLWEINSDGIAGQITGQNDDYLFGIPRANLELKQMSIIYSYKYAYIIFCVFGTL